MRFYSLLASVLLLCPLLTACHPNEAAKSVTIGSKQFTENVLLSEMYAQLIENYTDLEVVRKQNTGSTAVCFAAMENGDIDVYVEYTGTIYHELLGHEYEPGVESDSIYDLIKKEMYDAKGITVYQKLGLNNTYALAMLKAKANAIGIKTMSDLSPNAHKLVFAANDLYYMRANDGYDTMVEKYDIRFKSAAKMDVSSLYSAVADGQVDVIVVYATDSLLTKYDMVILEDDKRIFPAYYALPIIRNDVLKKHPELESVLDLLTNSIDNKRMQELNYLVEVENNSPEEIARAFLTELGLLNE